MFLIHGCKTGVQLFGVKTFLLVAEYFATNGLSIILFSQLEITTSYTAHLESLDKNRSTSIPSIREVKQNGASRA